MVICHFSLCKMARSVSWIYISHVSILNDNLSECHTLILIALAEVCVLRVLFYSWCIDCSGYQRSSAARTEAVRDTGRTWRRPVSGVLSNVGRHWPTTSGSFAWLFRFVSCFQCKFYLILFSDQQNLCYYFLYVPQRCALLWDSSLLSIAIITHSNPRLVQSFLLPQVTDHRMCCNSVS